ncbi:MAG TPA: ethylbenzene dehydrogenase-related protein [Candidatus Acidoferrales bacterium]|nr:ethylbenzene dehydrogenase-related protein [Candidatus Acidoferrales bacterium]
MKRLMVLVAGLVASAVLATCAVVSLSQAPREVAFTGDWEAIPARTITLFYPAQSSWQFLTSPAHPGAEPLKGGMDCATCHNPLGGAQKLGPSLVKHAKLEPDPIPGKRPTVHLAVKAAFDDEYIYFRFQWDAKEPGVTHTLWRYDGKTWSYWGGPKPDALKKKIPPSYEDRLAILIGERDAVPAYDGAKVTFSQAGCFITCHNSMRAMPREPSAGALNAHPFWGEKGRRVGDIRKYLLLTRTGSDDAGAWDKVKSPAELETLKKAGKFLDLWQWRAARSNPLGFAGDDYVLEYRLGDAGKSVFTTPAKPAWMYDASKTGFSAIPEADLPKMLDKFPLVIGRNAVALDPKTSFKTGDILPQPVLQEPSGSAADIQANGVWRNGRWTVDLKRRLNTGNPDDRVLERGKVYDIGLALFEDKVSNRRHHVSLPPITLGLGVDADIKAERVKK